MKEYKKWLENHYKTHRGNDYYEPTAKMGWKVALDWVKREAISLDERGDVSRKIIEEELAMLEFQGGRHPVAGKILTLYAKQTKHEKDCATCNHGRRISTLCNNCCYGAGVNGNLNWKPKAETMREVLAHVEAGPEADAGEFVEYRLQIGSNRPYIEDAKGNVLAVIYSPTESQLQSRCEFVLYACNYIDRLKADIKGLKEQQDAADRTYDCLKKELSDLKDRAMIIKKGNLPNKRVLNDYLEITKMFGFAIETLEAAFDSGWESAVIECGEILSRSKGK